jgi:pyruvate,water dikinase
MFDYANAWAVGTEPIGPKYWPAEIARRTKIVNALAQNRPAPAFNEPPAEISEPFTVMLWGITTEQVQQWLGSDSGNKNELKGMAASGGVAEGKARVIFSPDQLGELQQGEILVAPVTAPSWGPVFGKISATVTDIGGMMSHAAIVCREYGLPAVTGTGNASTTIKTGMTLRVDGTNGTVEIIKK